MQWQSHTRPGLDRNFWPTALTPSRADTTGNLNNLGSLLFAQANLQHPKGKGFDTVSVQPVTLFSEPAAGETQYGANAAGGIDVFDSTLTLVNSFAADSQPGPFTPYGIQTIGEEVF
jgi:hypothetical protein